MKLSLQPERDSNSAATLGDRASVSSGRAQVASSLFVALYTYRVTALVHKTGLNGWAKEWTIGPNSAPPYGRSCSESAVFTLLRRPAVLASGNPSGASAGRRFACIRARTGTLTST